MTQALSLALVFVIAFACFAVIGLWSGRRARWRTALLAAVREYDRQIDDLFQYRNARLDPRVANQAQLTWPQREELRRDIEDWICRVESLQEERDRTVARLASA